LVDEEGYEVDSEDDDERAQAAVVSAAEFDPYSDVKIECKLNRGGRTSIELYLTIAQIFSRP